MNPIQLLSDNDNLKLIRFLLISATLLVLASVIFFSIYNCRKPAEISGWVFTIIGALSLEFIGFSIWMENNRSYALEPEREIYIGIAAIALSVVLWGIFAGLYWYLHSIFWSLHSVMIYLIILALVYVSYHQIALHNNGLLAAIYCGLALLVIKFWIFSRKWDKLYSKPVISILTAVSYFRLLFPCFDFLARCFYGSSFSFSYQDLLLAFNKAILNLSWITTYTPIFMAIGIFLIYSTQMKKAKNWLNYFTGTESNPGLSFNK